MATVKVADKYSPDDVQKALELLEKAKVMKEKEKARMQNPEVKAKMQAAERKRQAGIKIVLQKAKAAKIEATEAEIEAYLKANPGRTK